MSFMGFVPAGCMMPYGGTTAPDGWLLCNGASASIAAYPALYAAIGVNWGDPGGGSFRIPDGRGAFFRGMGTSGVHVGPTTVGGEQLHATAKNGLGITNVSAATGISETSSGAHNHDVRAATTVNLAGGGGYTVLLNTGGDVQVAIASGGSSHAHSITDPSHTHNSSLNAGDTETRPNSRGVNWIIKI